MALGQKFVREIFYQQRSQLRRGAKPLSIGSDKFAAHARIYTHVAKCRAQRDLGNPDSLPLNSANYALTNRNRSTVDCLLKSSVISVAVLGVPIKFPWTSAQLIACRRES
jgi:hypothetical protein